MNNVLPLCIDFLRKGVIKIVTTYHKTTVFTALEQEMAEF